MTFKLTTAAAVAITLVSYGSCASAAQVWNQGFETDTSGWFDENSAWSGTATMVASGTGGITSSEGSFHAQFTQTDAHGGLTAPFSRFDGYRDSWPGGMTASIDVYLDTAWAMGEGFDYSVAANGTDGNHLQDFIFHVTQDTSTGNLLIGGSNNTNFDPREDLESINHFVVPTSGWYTFEHDFYDAGDGTLAVDLNLRDSVGSLLFTETRNTPANVLATVVGGNRYAWFTNIDIAGGIAVDAHSLAAVPEPGTLAMLGLAGTVGLAVYARRRRA